MKTSDDGRPDRVPRDAKWHGQRRYGWLRVEYYVGSRDAKGAIWKCQCLCGNQVDVLAANLVTGNTQSCGCLKILLPAAKSILAEFRKASEDYSLWGQYNYLVCVHLVGRVCNERRIDRPVLVYRLCAALRHGIRIDVMRMKGDSEPRTCGQEMRIQVEENSRTMNESEIADYRYHGSIVP